MSEEAQIPKGGDPTSPVSDVDAGIEVLAAALTSKEQAFVEAYCANGWNATEAALAAGYTDKRTSAAALASKILRKAHVRAYIDARLDEAAMPANEILARLARIARGDMSDFLTINKRGVARLDFKKAQELGVVHLAKKVTRKDGSLTLELYDAQSALETLAKHRGLLKDGASVEVNIEIGRMDLSKLSNEELEALEQIAAKACSTAEPG